MNGQVAKYRGLVETLAEQFARSNPNELDDLVQEGLIFVWQTLQRGHRVSEEHIRNRMLNWLSYRSRQLRHQDKPYEVMLPLEDLRDANAQVVAVREPAGHGPDEDE